jgi:hypothetical protein
MDIDSLIKLQKLKEKGIISEKEFNTEKYQIIYRDKLIRESYSPMSGCLIVIVILIFLSINILLFLFIVFISDISSIIMQT